YMFLPIFFPACLTLYFSLFLFVLLTRPSPSSTLFPYTTLFRSLSHPAPDFVKCDVEGSEVAVFEGAERLLREKRPILLVEMHGRSEEHTSELQSPDHLVCRLLLEKKKLTTKRHQTVTTQFQPKT